MPLLTCEACPEQGDAARIKACSVCGTVRYCCVECQKNDWPNHKATCTKAAAKALFAAIGRNDGETVRKLARTKRVLNARVNHAKEPDEHGRSGRKLGKWTALHECVRFNHAEMMKILLETGEANVDIVDVDGETPLFVASGSAGSLGVVELLLGAGADPNARAGDGWNCLMVAVREGMYDVTKELLDNGADPHEYGGMFGQSLLDMAAQLMTGQGTRMSQDESWDLAIARYKRVHHLLQHYE